MSYGIRRRAVVGAELRRVIRKQLALALEELSGPRAADERTVHEARRRIKKVRAAVRLCREGFGGEFRRLNRRMRRACGRLGPIAEAEAMVRTFEMVAAAHPTDVPAPAAEAVRQQLRDGLAVADARAAKGRIIQRVRQRLAKARAQTDDAWPVEGDEVTVVQAGFARTLRRSRRAMTRAQARATRRRYHTWRRRAKDHWLQLRLLAPRCAGGLATEIVRLEQLDETLGQAHDLALLANVFGRGMKVARPEAAAILGLVRREMWRCRRAALALAKEVYAEPDEVLVDRLPRDWLRAPDRVEAEAKPAPASESSTCHRVA